MTTLHSLNSQLTLVDPNCGAPEGAKASVVIDFAKDDMKNSTASFRDARLGDPSYAVKTKLAAKGDGATSVRRNGVLIAEVDRRDILPDEITRWFGEDDDGKANFDVDAATIREGAEEPKRSGGRKMRLAKWLKGPMNPLAPFPVAMEEGGKKYEWRESIVGQIALYEVNASDTTPIAWFQGSLRRVVDGQRVVYGAYLALTPAAEDMVDAVFVSAVLMSQKAKMRGYGGKSEMMWSEIAINSGRMGGMDGFSGL